ncbi:MAG TPA: DUF4157 domain-containing protein, partial [Pyrinomonadaceae bacterium]
MERQQGVKNQRAEARGETRGAARRDPAAPRPHPALELQAAIGNRAAGRLLQAKLRVSQPGDHFEREADSVAEQVMREPEPSPAALAPGGEGGRAAEGEGAGGRPRLQAARAGAGQGAGDAAAPPIVYEVLGAGGRPLDAEARAFFEPRFGLDFSQVRVHTDARAAESAREVGALAYTVGSDLVFGEGMYAPGTEAGRRLLAHELTHVAQQQAAGPMVQLASNRSPLDALDDGGLFDDVPEARDWSPAPHEATVIGAAGEKLDVEDLKAQLREQGYDEVYSKEEFGKKPGTKWLQQAYPDGRKRPDIVAVNNKTREIVVVDVTASYSSHAQALPGDPKPLPVEMQTQENQRFKGNRYRSADLADEMKPSTFKESPVQPPENTSKLHIEKTVEDARQLARSLKGEREKYKVKAMDVHWRTGTQTKQILVKAAQEPPGGATPPPTRAGDGGGKQSATPAPAASEAAPAPAPHATTTPAQTTPAPAPHTTAPASHATAPASPAAAPAQTAPTTAPPAAATTQTAPPPAAAPESARPTTAPPAQERASLPPPTAAETTAAARPAPKPAAAPAAAAPEQHGPARPLSAGTEAPRATPPATQPRGLVTAPPSSPQRIAGGAPAAAPSQLTTAESRPAARPSAATAELEAPGPRGMGLRGEPSPLVGAAVGLAANVAGSLLTSWMHDSILKSVNEMPPPVIDQAQFWKEGGMRGRTGLDLLATNIEEARVQFHEGRARLSFDVLSFWGRLDALDVKARFAALESLEDAAWQDMSQLLTAQSNLGAALALEPQIQEGIEAAAALQSYIKSPFGTMTLVYGVGMDINEISRISDNLAWYQSANKRMLGSLRELSAEVERQIAANDALREQIAAARRRGGRVPR